MLKLDGDGPLYLQVYRMVRSGILDGTLEPGERLPSTRALADELGVSRTVTLNAYDQLTAEGYVSGSIGSGTRVASSLPDLTPAGRAAAAPPAPSEPVEPPLSRRGRRVLEAAPLTERPQADAPLPYAFSYGFAPPLPESMKVWRRFLSQAAARASLDYGAPEGDLRLRRALATHLAKARGLSCTADQIVMVAGSQQALDLCAQLLLDPEETVLIEDPHYQGARAVFQAAGARLVPVPVDDEGLDVEHPACADLRPQLIYITPSHQFPTGAVMSLSRRLALLDWANERNVFILEDDYDGEYRYESRPLEAVQALDRHGRTIYAGTLSKVLFPALRVGYLVLPPSLVPLFRAGKWIVDRHGPSLEQEALADFLESGQYERHVRRMRRRHASRRNALTSALQDRLGDEVEVMGTNAGIHLVAWLPRLAPDRLPELVERAAEVGVGIRSISPYFSQAPQRAGLLLGYGALEEWQIEEGIRRLADVLEGALRKPSAAALRATRLRPSR